MNIKEFILNELQKNYAINDVENLEELNFVEEGYITSLGLIQFVVVIEEKYDIRFTEEEIMSTDFQVIGNLVELIKRKIADK